MRIFHWLYFEPLASTRRSLGASSSLQWMRIIPKKGFAMFLQFGCGCA
jgi:hypothetical protein